MTRRLIYLNVGVYAILAVLSGNPLFIDIRLLALLGQFNYAVLYWGWWWQLITSMFVHVDILHLLFNMLALYYFGRVVEVAFGPRRMLAIYFASGLAGNLLTLAVLPPLTISAGASGCIFGLIGAYAILEHMSGRSLLSIFAYLAFVFLASASPSVNVVAHLGGLVPGLILGKLFFEKIGYYY